MDAILLVSCTDYPFGMVPDFVMNEVFGTSKSTLRPQVIITSNVLTKLHKL